MSDFINRFLNIRGVIKNIYAQIKGLDEVVFRQCVSLGKRPGETLSNWRCRSHAGSTYLWDYNRGDDIVEVANTALLKYRTESLLSHLKNVYIGLLDTIHCKIPYFVGDDLEKTDESDKEILDVILPDEIIDDAMTHDHALMDIADDIINIVGLGYNGTDCPHLFGIDGKEKIYQVLRTNRLPAGMPLDSKPWLNVGR